MKYAISVKIEPDGRLVHLQGREAWALRELVKAGSRGVTPIDVPGPRWSHYVWLLRRDGFVVETEHEPHGGPFPGTHARYRLHTPVSIVEDARAAA